MSGLEYPNMTAELWNNNNESVSFYANKDCSSRLALNSSICGAASNYNEMGVKYSHFFNDNKLEVYSSVAAVGYNYSGSLGSQYSNILSAGIAYHVTKNFMFYIELNTQAGLPTFNNAKIPSNNVSESVSSKIGVQYGF